MLTRCGRDSCIAPEVYTVEQYDALQKDAPCLDESYDRYLVALGRLVQEL